MRKHPQEFIDKFGVFDASNHRGGDTAHRVGMYWFLYMVMKPALRKKYKVKMLFREMFPKIHPYPGIIIRHPNPDWDASDWDRGSKDQHKSCIMACGLNSKKELEKMTMGHAMRLFLFTHNNRENGANKRTHGEIKNRKGEKYDYSWRLPDFTFIDFWAIYIRAWNAWFFWPLLFIFDFFYLIPTALKWRYWPQHNIAMNSALYMLQASHRLSTPWVWLSRKIMPPEKLIKLIGEHFRDFNDDMIFFEDMFLDAWRTIREKCWFV